ncbi:type II toxin-antitoxin system ParD family antitoxin [Flavobacterium sp. KACC 22761]|uniref:ribbon-helix-helix domain-containing protein n=1 Tax=Flavobacterium sp. KACC 22761 TaxID=3092665 RepID=UPI002A748C66|nr:CopG family transcriptional regulator [Flavobacterium sp. KACC 22761]WPO77886.1 CopG family transcriptional regulator [Flavobacterium sp. KACC 22761]
MTRQSISLTTPNEEWLKNQVNTEEFSSKSEVINYLIKQARSREEYFEFVRAKIDKGEKSGFAKKQTKEEMLAEFKKDQSNV